MAVVDYCDIVTSWGTPEEYARSLSAAFMLGAGWRLFVFFAFREKTLGRRGSENTRLNFRAAFAERDAIVVMGCEIRLLASLFPVAEAAWESRSVALVFRLDDWAG